MITGKFGWDHMIRVCWLTDINPHNRLVWQITTQLVWIILAEFITTVCALVTIAHLYKHKVCGNIQLLSLVILLTFTVYVNQTP